MSQEKLGNALGLTFQQIQKYERGANRIGSSRLFQLSRILDVPVAFFFDDMPPEVAGASRGLSDTNVEPFESEQLARRETLELVRAYYRITDGHVRKRIFELVKSVATSTIRAKS
ncbi:MAG: XRE family transcriptional regulator [Alphaproteobacteria bacterium]|nr:MAG: XRE family transcriptional regulator [Alphaproteobacteria bacterium]